jgi:cytochrome c oxidase subunit III
MDLGTIEPLTQPPSRRKRIRRTSGGSGRGSGNGGKNGGNGGGSDGPDSNNPEQDSSFAPPDKARVVTWFLLPTVMMTFAGMMGAYIVVATNRQSEWQPFALPNQLWISTVILAVSSYTLQTAKNAIDREQHQKAKNWLIATTALGATFISSQFISWLALVSQGLYMRGNPYAGFFYILTIAHAVHVLGGVIALGAIQLRAWYPSADENELEHRRNLARSVTYYWHFLGLLWVVLLGLLAFWK